MHTPIGHEAKKGGAAIASVQLTVLAVIALLAALHLGKVLLFPIVFATFLSLLLSPLIIALGRLRIPRHVGAALIIGVVGSFSVVGVSELMEPAGMWLDRAPEVTAKLERRFKSWKQPLESINTIDRKLQSAAGASADDAVTVKISQPFVASSLMTGTSSLLSNILAIVVLTFFFLAGGDRLLLKLVEGMPRLEQKKQAVEVVRAIQQNISFYLINVTIINAGLGLVVGLVLWLIGFPNPALWGALVFVLNFAPYIGPTIGVAVLSLAGLLTYQEPLRAFTPALVCLAFNLVEGNVVTPAILGYRLDLDPIAMLLFMFLWTWLWGFPGALLALPILTCVKIVCDHTERFKPVGLFLVR